MHQSKKKVHARERIRCREVAARRSRGGRRTTFPGRKTRTSEGKGLNRRIRSNGWARGKKRDNGEGLKVVTIAARENCACLIYFCSHPAGRVIVFGPFNESSESRADHLGKNPPLPWLYARAKKARHAERKRRKKAGVKKKKNNNNKCTERVRQ